MEQSSKGNDVADCRYFPAVCFLTDSQILNFNIITKGCLFLRYKLQISLIRITFTFPVGRQRGRVAVGRVWEQLRGLSTDRKSVRGERWYNHPDYGQRYHKGRRE